MPTKEERLRKIVDWISAENNLSIKELSQRLQVSSMTVWRDLGELEKSGEVRRVRGGASKIISDDTEEREEPFFDSKTALHNLEKCNIARYAATQLVDKDQIIIIEGGTTVGAMLDYLDQPNLTVLTNGLHALVTASQRLDQLSVIGCGGMLRQKSLTFVGPQAEAFFGNFHAHKFFLGATGLTLTEGVTDPNPLEIQIKRAMHRAAEQTILLVDSSKFGVRSLAQILPLEEIDMVVTDQNTPAEFLEQLSERGIEIHIACPPEQPDN